MLGNKKYEAIEKEEYEKLEAEMEPFDAKLLLKYEESETELDMSLVEECAQGVCPLR